MAEASKRRRVLVSCVALVAIVILAGAFGLRQWLSPGGGVRITSCRLVDRVPTADYTIRNDTSKISHYYFSVDFDVGGHPSATSGSVDYADLAPGHSFKGEVQPGTMMINGAPSAPIHVLGDASLSCQVSSLVRQDTVTFP